MRPRVEILGLLKCTVSLHGTMFCRQELGMRAPEHPSRNQQQEVGEGYDCKDLLSRDAQPNLHQQSLHPDARPNLLQNLLLRGSLCIRMLLFSKLSHKVCHRRMMSWLMIPLYLLTLICM